MKILQIDPVDWTFAEAAQQRWDSLIKPKGSLGILEDLVSRLCAVKRTLMPQINRKKIVIFAADHGIVEEGVSAYPPEVTQQMVRGFLCGRAAICVLARSCDIQLQIVDAGMRSPLELPDLVQLHINNGTKNFLNEPAMTSEELDQALLAGTAIAHDAAACGIDLIAGGEMGIGNTTSASAIFSALLGIDPREITGYGTGISDEVHARKIAIIERAVQKRILCFGNPLEVLRQVGGYEIACLTGLYLGAASRRLPVVIDGFICTAAAAIAMTLVPCSRDYFFFAHHSAERGFERVMGHLKIKPLLDLQMRLGEGTGAALAMQLMENGVRLYREMPTFEEADVFRSIS